MAGKSLPHEIAIIDKIQKRKGSKGKRIPAEKLAVFKQKLGEEIESSGKLRQESVDDLLRQLKNGAL